MVVDTICLDMLKTPSKVLSQGKGDGKHGVRQSSLGIPLKARFRPFGSCASR